LYSSAFWFRFVVVDNATEKFLNFCSIVPQHLKFAFDFRDSSWFCDSVLDELRQRDWAVVIHQHPAIATKLIVCSISSNH
jgi:hypothetical protein